MGEPKPIWEAPTDQGVIVGFGRKGGKLYYHIFVDGAWINCRVDGVPYPEPYSRNMEHPLWYVLLKEYHDSPPPTPLRDHYRAIIGYPQ